MPSAARGAISRRERSKLACRAEQRRRDAVTTLWTIGYARATPESLIATLHAAEIELLVDVRAVPASRRPGFSKGALAAALREAGIDYRHLKGLGTPAAGREAARAGRLERFEAIFRTHLESLEAQADSASASSASRAIRPTATGRS